MSHIYIKGSRWYISFWHGSKQYHISLRIPSSIPRREVQIAQHKFDYDLAIGKLDPEEYLKRRKSEITLYEFLDRLTDYYHKQRKGKTLDSYLYSINKLKQVVGKDIPIIKITKTVADEEICSQIKEQYAYDSIIHHISNFRSFFSKAVEWEIVAKNPFSGLVPPRKKRKPRYYSKEELVQIESYFKSKPKWQYDVVFFCLNTGLRKAELLTLSWDQIDLQNGHLIFSGKGNQERIVPINSKARAILLNRPRNLSDHRLFWDIPDKHPINSAWRRFKEVTKINGTFHQLRKTFASYYIMNGGSILKLKEILGHSDINTTLIYSGLSPESLQKDKEIVNF